MDRWKQEDAVFQTFPRHELKLIRNWLPAHARYWVFLGVVTDSTEENVTVQVYGPCDRVDQIAAIRRAKP